MNITLEYLQRIVDTQATLSTDEKQEIRRALRANPAMQKAYTRMVDDFVAEEVRKHGADLDGQAYDTEE